MVEGNLETKAQDLAMKPEVAGDPTTLDEHKKMLSKEMETEEKNMQQGNL